MIELILNGINIDLTGNEDVALSYAASKLQDIKSRNGDFSTTFKVPLTNVVKQAIGHSNNFTSNSSFPYRVAEAEIRESGVTVMRGFARIEKIASEIEVNVFSGNSNWFDLIRNKSLQELDLSHLDHDYTAASIEANRLNTYVSGFVYPNIYYGGFTNPLTPYSASDFFPSIYYNCILKQIFADIGWTVEGEILDDELFKKSAVLFSNDLWQRKSNGKVFKCEVTNQNYITGVTGFDYVGFNIKEYDHFKLFKAEPAFTNVIGDAAYWEVFVGADFRIKGSLSFITNTTTSPMDLNIGIIPAVGTTPSIYHTLTTLFPGSAGTTLKFDWDIILNLPASGGNKYCLFLGSSGTNSLENFSGYIELYSDASFYKNVEVGGITDLAMCLPKEINQLDWVKQLINQFSLIIIPDSTFKKVTFRYFEKVIENKANARDWSNKVDLRTHPEIEHLSENYAQRSILKYANDSNDPLLNNLNIGQGVFEIDDKNLPFELVIYESGFSGIARTSNLGNTVASIPIRESSVTPRIGCISITNDNLIKQFGQATPTQSAEVFFNDLSFENLIPKYYSGLVVAFNRFKMIRLYLNLTAADINQIDYMRPIYLNFISDWLGHVNGYFYLNLVDQYKPGAGEATLVETVNI